MQSKGTIESKFLESVVAPNILKTSVMPKRSLSKALKQVIEHHEMVCLDDREIIVGAAIDFDDDTSSCEERCPYFIHDGNVLLTISCPAGPHEAFSGTLSIIMYEGFK